MSFSSDILTSFKINLDISFNIEHRKKFKKKAFTCENVCHLSKKDVFLLITFFLKQLSTKSSVTVDMKVVCLHLLS